MSNHTSSSPTRRTLLRGAAATGALALGFGALDGLVRTAAAAPGSAPAGLGQGGYGPLQPVTRPDPVTGFTQELMLPEGFDFAIFGLAGTVLADDHVTPLGHDGMAAFRGPRGSYRLVRNHEERTGAGSVTPSGDPADRYDALGGGGTTTLQVRFRRGPARAGAGVDLAGRHDRQLRRWPDPVGLLADLRGDHRRDRRRLAAPAPPSRSRSTPATTSGAARRSATTGGCCSRNLQGSTSGDPSNPGLPGRTVAIWGPWHRGAL